MSSRPPRKGSPGYLSEPVHGVVGDTRLRLGRLPIYTDGPFVKENR